MLKNKYYVILGVLVLAVVMSLILASIIKKSTAQVALEKVKKEDLKEPVQPAVHPQAQLIMQHSKNGENDLTIRLAKEYLASNPNDINIINVLTETYINAGDFTSAEVAAKSTIAKYPDDPWSCRLLGRIYRERHKEQNIKSDELALLLKQVEGGLVSNPNDIWLLAEVAQLYSKQGNKDKANQTIDRALNINPKNPHLIQTKKSINQELLKK